MLIGYARVSTKDQVLDAQMDTLRDAGCERVFHEFASGARADRPILNEALDFVRSGDVIVVTKLDRIARSLSHLTALSATMESRGVGFRSLGENLDTTSAGGRLVFNLFGALAEWERDLIRERTRAGLDAARRRGRVGGRPRKMTPDKTAAAKSLLASGRPAADVAAALEVSVATLYRHLASQSLPG